MSSSSLHNTHPLTQHTHTHTVYDLCVDPARVVCASRACHVRVPRPRPLLVAREHTDPRAVPEPAWCSTSAWDPVRVIRASRTRAMFVCRVLV
eukprot:6203348-Prymnesium_polylepis.1